MIRAAALVLLLALAGCGGNDDSASGGLSRSEQRQLDDAAEATDINAVAAPENAQ